MKILCKLKTCQTRLVRFRWLLRSNVLSEKNVFFNLVKNWGPDKGEKRLRKNGEEINKRKPAECTEVLPAVLSRATEKWSILPYSLNHYSSREICDKNISMA